VALEIAEDGLAGEAGLLSPSLITLCQVVRAVDGHIVAAASTVETAQREALPTRSDKVCHNPLHCETCCYGRYDRGWHRTQARDVLLLV